MIRRIRRTDKEVRQDSVIREQDKMIRALTEELVHARLDERQRIREYVLKRMGHCDDCAIVIAWEDFGNPNVPESECSCAWQTVEGLFDEIAGGQR